MFDVDMVGKVNVVLGDDVWLYYEFLFLNGGVVVFDFLIIWYLIEECL